MRRRDGDGNGTATVAIATTGVVGAVCAGIAGILATATVSARPPVFLAAGLAAFAVADGMVAYALGRRIRRAVRRRVRWTFFASTVVALVAAFAVIALRPPAPTAAGPSLAGESVVTVSTGSRLAVVHLPARGPTHRAPIVVVHGGPGVPDLAANAKAFAPLATHGSDVYLYAQLGTARSGRLALRHRLGLDRMALVGHSYGGNLAAAYAVAHPQHVRALVLISPGALDPSDSSSNDVLGRLPPRRRLHAYAAVLAPRPMLGYALLQVNPRAAHTYFPDREADARNDAVVSLSSPALHCNSATRTPEPVHGTGFYAMQYPHSAVEYRRLLPRSRLVYLHGVGHNLHQDRPAVVCAMTDALLDGTRLPVAAYAGDAPPKDYQGPP